MKKRACIFRARFYDASVGRFLSFDPILHTAYGPPTCCGPGRDLTIDISPFEYLQQNPQTLNPYVYVQNRPTVLTDPTGLGPPCECVFYDKLCDQCDSYACVARRVCREAGDTPYWNCVRNCLIPKYNDHRNPWRALFIDHAVCFTNCSP